MTMIPAIRFLRLLPVVAAILFVLSSSRPAAAAGCFVNLRTCYYAAANAMDWLDLWLMGLDCELDFTDCMRREIIGR
jgi:hypothetical protein